VTAAAPATSTAKAAMIFQSYVRLTIPPSLLLRADQVIE
jgi:hypothetical protein